MDMEAQTNANTSAIADLTMQVTKLTTVVGYEVERAKEDRGSVKDMVGELKGLNEKISAMASVQKEMAQSAKDITELRTRVDQLKEWKDKYDLSSFNSRIGALESTKEREEGAAKAVATGADWFWRLFGPIVTLVMMAAMGYAFTHATTYTHESTYSEQSHGPITGE